MRTCGQTDLYRFLIFEKTVFYHYHVATLLTLPYLKSYLTFYHMSYITYLMSYLTLPYLNLSYLTVSYHTLPYLTIPYRTLTYRQHHEKKFNLSHFKYKKYTGY